MSDDPLQERCAGMSDLELVRALTVDRDANEEVFRIAAGRELTARGIDLATFLARVRLRVQSDVEQRQVETVTLSLDEALGRLARPMSEWETTFVANALGDWVVVQQDGVFHESHFFVDGDYLTSCTTASPGELHRIVGAFLRLEDWEAWLDRDYDLADWSTVVQADNPALISSVARTLAEAGIPFALRGLDYSRFDAIMGTHAHIGGNVVLVDDARLDAAWAAIDATERRLDELGAQAAALQGGGQREAALEVYRELTRLAPHDAGAQLHLGALLLELGRHRQAGEPLMRAIEVGDEETVAGAVRLLEQVAGEHPGNLATLHTLAGVHARGDTARAEKFYRMILAADPEDVIAHQNLGHLYLMDDRPGLARDHFATFLKLRPEADERPAIETILGELDGQLETPES